MHNPAAVVFPISIRGRYWLPQHPQLIMTGELKISSPTEYDVFLDLPHYGLSHPAYWEGLTGQPIPIIFGLTDRGEKITLSDCGIYSNGIRYAAPRSVSWHSLKLYVHRCIRGEHVSDVNALRFRAFSLYYTGFNQFASGYDTELFQKEDEDSWPSKVKRKDSVPGFGELKIFAAGSGSSTFGNVATQQQVRYWKPHFVPTTNISIDQLLEVIRDFQTLLCLLEGEPVGFDDIHCHPEGTEGEEEPIGIDLFVMMTGFKTNFIPRHTREMLVPLSLIGDAWPNVVAKWFQLAKPLAPVLNLYFTVVYGDHLFEEHRFLFLAQAVEGYHRCSVNPKDISFAERLNQITAPLATTLAPFIPDLPNFCTNVKNARNTFTHPNPDTARNSYDVSTLWRQLRTLIEICLLRDLGLPEAVLQRVASVHRDR